MSNDSLSIDDPSQLTPLFTVQAISCAYPISDLYASSPRYLYYALLVSTFLTQWYPWLANVFLGAAATYAGTAAIEAIILISNPAPTYPAVNVTIPFIASTSIRGNATLEALPNLYTSHSSLVVQPAALETDVDGILAIVITGYLMMLPIHCWSPVIKAHRIRHVLMSIWNCLMLAGTICGILIWVRAFDIPYQYRFCYPSYADPDSVTSDSSQLPDGIWQGDWNSTIWNTYDNLSNFLNLPDQCLYPCFNTSQIMRRPQSLQASVKAATRSPRFNTYLSARKFAQIDHVTNVVYSGIAVSTAAAITLLLFTLPQLRRLTRVPVHKPTLFVHRRGKDLLRTLWVEFKQGMKNLALGSMHPYRTMSAMRSMSGRQLWHIIWITIRWFIDILALVFILTAMVIIPITIIFFIVWIESYIHNDEVSSETPSQVGQWTSSVSIALVLISALIIQLKYRVASLEEIEDEIEKKRKHLNKLEVLRDRKKRDEENVEIEERRQSQTRRKSNVQAARMDIEMQAKDRGEAERSVDKDVQNNNCLFKDRHDT